MGVLSLTILLLEIYGSFLFYILIIFKFLYGCHFCSCLHIYTVCKIYNFCIYILYIQKSRHFIIIINVYIHTHIICYIIYLVQNLPVGVLRQMVHIF